MSTLEYALKWMARNSQSVTLNWGEDTGTWECSWIVKGERHTGVSEDARTAVSVALEQAGAFPFLDPTAEKEREEYLEANSPFIDAGAKRWA